MGSRDRVYDRKMQALLQLLDRTREASVAEWATITRIEQVDRKAFARAMRLAERFEAAGTPAERDTFRERHRDEILAISFNAWQDAPEGAP
jgi:proline dehydrogenase